MGKRYLKWKDEFANVPRSYNAKHCRSREIRLYEVLISPTSRGRVFTKSLKRLYSQKGPIIVECNPENCAWGLPSGRGSLRVPGLVGCERSAVHFQGNGWWVRGIRKAMIGILETGEQVEGELSLDDGSERVCLINPCKMILS
jgi:hypothetical protein